MEKGESPAIPLKLNIWDILFCDRFIAVFFLRAGQRGRWRYASGFDGTKNNAVITVENKDQNNNIVQSRLSVVDAASPAKDAFIITPPLFRLKAGEKGFVRVVRSGKKLPDDRESMFWLNIKGIPATEYVPDKNVVQFAINSKIKLIYRPAALKGNTPEAYAEKLQWGKRGRRWR